MLVRETTESNSLAHRFFPTAQALGCLRTPCVFPVILSTRANKHFQAGIVIAQEAGGLIRGSPSTLDDAHWFTEEFLWGRKYIVVRCITFFTDPVITRCRTIVFTFFV